MGYTIAVFYGFLAKNKFAGHFNLAAAFAIICYPARRPLGAPEYGCERRCAIPPDRLRNLHFRKSDGGFAHGITETRS